MLSDFELAVELKLTQAFILADPTTLSVRRQSRVNDGAGGFRLAPFGFPILVQVRMIPDSGGFGNDTSVDVSRGTNGVVADHKFTLLAMPDADIRRYDVFYWNGIDWFVSQLHLTPEYELKADIERQSDA